MQGASKQPPVLPPAYIDTVIQAMRPKNDETPQRKKKVAEQEKALRHLKRVMEARLRSESLLAGQADGLVFG